MIEFQLSINKTNRQMLTVIKKEIDPFSLHKNTKLMKGSTEVHRVVLITDE